MSASDPPGARDDDGSGSGARPGPDGDTHWGRDWAPHPGWGADPPAGPRPAVPHPPGPDPGRSLGDLLETGLGVLRRHLLPLLAAGAPLAVAVLLAEVLGWWLATTALQRLRPVIDAIAAGPPQSAVIGPLLAALVWLTLAALALAVVVGGVRALVDGWVATIVAAAVTGPGSPRLRPVAGRVLVSGLVLTGLAAVAFLPGLLLALRSPTAGVLTGLVLLPAQLVLLVVLFVRSSLMPAGMVCRPSRARVPWGVPVTWRRFWPSLGILVLAAALASAVGSAASLPVQVVAAALAPPVEDLAVLLDPDWWRGPFVLMAGLTHLVAVWVGYPVFSVVSALLGSGVTRQGRAPV